MFTDISAMLYSPSPFVFVDCPVSTIVTVAPSTGERYLSTPLWAGVA